LGISSAAYGLGAGLFFLTYALFEIPSNLIMHRVGARFWITRIMITWGALSVAMAFVSGETSFYVMRLLLGVAEAGLFPGVMLYLTYWFGREERARATGYFLLGVCIANIVGGPLAGALIELDGTLGFHGWQWLFVVEGIPAILLAFVAFTLLVDRPQDAPWLTSDEKARVAALCAEGRAHGNAHDGRSVMTALANPRVYLFAFIYFSLTCASLTLNFWMPLMIRDFGVTDVVAVSLYT
ncbi:MFS transporter, partial [Bacillus licheniformis]|nr:MFS transporter [Bacillus licheniformis]